LITTEEIEGMIQKKIPGANIRVADMTGTGDHFEIEVVSELFKGKSLIDQHRMVFAALEKEMDGRIHAVQLKTKSP